MAQTLLLHAKGVLTELLQDRAHQWKDGGQSTEKIRGLLASAFGFHDQDFLRLYALHEAEFKFVG